MCRFGHSTEPRTPPSLLNALGKWLKRSGMQAHIQNIPSTKTLDMMYGIMRLMSRGFSSGFSARGRDTEHLQTKSYIPISFRRNPYGKMLNNIKISNQNVP